MLPGRDRPARLLLVLAAALEFGCSDPRSATIRPASWTEPRTGMVFLQLEPGAFLMGSPLDEPGRETGEHQHTVQLTRHVWLGKFEVTQRQWLDVMGTNPSWFRDQSETRPVENVTWHEVRAFLDRLNAQTPGYRFRLPTEAEWEYACRAGMRSPYATGSTLTSADANIAVSAERAAAGEGSTRTVGAFPPNPWGFHDMHGNVWEWTDDDYCPYPDGNAVDPVPNCAAPLKVIRGGSWYFEADSARCALRYTHRPQDRGFSLGFRVARD